MDLPSIAAILVPLGAVVVAGYRALRSRDARAALVAEVERWARSAAVAVWYRAARSLGVGVELAPAFAAELLGYATRMGIAVGPREAKAAAVIAYQLWVELLGRTAPMAAARLEAQLTELGDVVGALERQLASGTIVVNDPDRRPRR